MSFKNKPVIYVIYGSCSGNVEWFCEEICKSIKFKTELHRAEVTDISLVKRNKIFIFAASTWEHGRIIPFFDVLMKSMRYIDMSGKKAGFIGLGDTRYSKAHFAAGIDKLSRLFIERGGSLAVHTMKINGDPYDQMCKPYVSVWVDKFTTFVRQYYDK